jgi:type IV pilus assembly protein PilM
MAGKPGAWGIDIGQAGLKAIRLEINDATEHVHATAFDYIAHPKILSQPDAIPEELISQALDKFLKQNDIANDLVAISVPGQSALARFIQLPPVESSKVSEIVKYEARQQIPFALEDVVWDYQTLGKGTEESGFLLEAEVGLFAMKRDQVMNQLKPFTNADIEVELIQIAPLALYNFLSFDQLGIRLGDDVVAMDAYTILLDMGADNTTLLVSNGQKIWIRNVPIGGNHFTRALTKEMKLTFAKAEHLKCNATKSPDPRAVFQALRPVFNDYVSEIQRSIGYFSSVNREAKIAKVVGLGNGFKLAGLQKFLQQNLQYEVERIETFSGISADGFKDAAMFEENILSFPVCYGVALQALRQTRIRTSLLPREISTARTIARKKPWAVAAAAVLLVALATSAFGFARVLDSVSDSRFGPAEKEIDEVTKQARDLKTAYQKENANNLATKKEGSTLVGALDRRTQWLELYKAVSECLPRDQVEKQDIRLQNRVIITSFLPRFYPDLATWYNGLSPHAKELFSEADRKAPPSGPGYVVTLQGFHYHDETMGKRFDYRPEGFKDKAYDPQSNLALFGEGYLNTQLLSKLQEWSVPARDKSGEVKVGGIGISNATIADCPLPFSQEMDPLGESIKPQINATSGRPGMAGGQRFGGMNAGGSGMGSNFGQRNKKKDKRGEGGMSSALSDLNMQSPDGADEKAKKKKETVSCWRFAIEFVWTPDKPQPKPGAVADASLGSGGTAAASHTTANSTKTTPASSAPKK